MSVRVKLLALALAVVMVVVAAGCGSSGSDSSSSSEPASTTEEAATTEASSTSEEASSDEGETTTGPGGGAAGKNIYYVGAGDINPWSKTFNATIIDKLKEEGANVTYLQDPYDAQIEVENLNRAVAANPDLIIMLPIEYPGLVPGLTRAKAAGIPVINTTSSPGPAEDLFTADIQGNHKELGQFAAENIIEGLESQGKKEGNIIAITGNKSLSQIPERMGEFERVLAEKAPGLKLVAVEDGNWDQATSQKLAQQLFAKYQSQGGIQGAYGMADNQAVGIIQAAKEAGLKLGGKDGLIVTGSNCFQAGLEAIKNGEMWGTGSQSPTQEAAFVNEQVLKWLNGETIPVRQEAKETRVTKANLKEAETFSCT
jgi:ABC-type sugar transport system substrate-binding protein